ncbi:uncharacterized protein LOC130981044 [Arachis stenosperma]|uniref:uncharacterized protein LOC130981044 n=1 Tax=Arachis stenosperma TaxID=217475 RepID=UPI0025AC49DD|nr:uncharacterized protein LOC130981044 [Arachis stenosperma]
MEGLTQTKDGTKLLKLNPTKTRKPTILNIPKVNHNTNNPTNNPTNNHHNLNLKRGINTQIGSINAITLRSGNKLDKIGVVPTKLSEEINNEEVGYQVEVMRDEDKNIDKDEEEPLKVKEPKRKNLLEEPMPILFPTLAKKAKK